MKTIAMVCLALMLSLGFASTTFAGGGAKGQKGERGAQPIERIKGLLSKLSLSTDQTDKVGTALESAETKLQALRTQAKSGGDRSQLREQIRGIVKDAVQQISQVLTPEQKKQFMSDLQQAREQRQQERKSKDSSTTQPAA